MGDSCRGTHGDAADDELVALEAIFGEALSLVRSASAPTTGSLVVPVALAEPLVLRLGTADPEAASDGEAPTETIEHLPPVTIRFQVPADYPESSCLHFMLVCAWLAPAQLAAVLEHLVGLWETDHDVVLFRWSDFLASELLDFLGIVTNDSPPALAISHDVPDRAALVDAIMEHDARERELIFQRDRFDCGVCFESKRGTHCFQFPACAHVYCRECLVDYFTLMITEGSVNFVGCPDAACKKAAANADRTVRHIAEADLDRLLDDADLVERWRTLSEKRALEGRSDVTHCPRPLCLATVIKDPRDAKLCICPECKYAFCMFCNRGWHGNNQFCKIGDLEKIADEYTSPTTSARRIAELELRYSKAVLERVARNVAAERDSRKWIELNAQRCPNCEAVVEKSDGCNHMTCRVCNSHFCYLCAAMLDKARPYAHFNTPASQCFNRLFEGVEGAQPRQDEPGDDSGDDDADPNDRNGGNGPAQAAAPAPAQDAPVGYAIIVLDDGREQVVAIH
ncbi:hypothetical protein HK105_207990 [Polyrhizophydium stewartii]|uniref:RBR-type E3 ubiquitin transferase n=1 Tax=Polyrhizophydium stewartii TaxID=2732419 RepID=A0ABR4MZ00_9FUNG|nr:E3 ubiquitin-protein ligase rnf14 [Polyrhizophydium stewartii]